MTSLVLVMRCCLGTRRYYRCCRAATASVTGRRWMGRAHDCLKRFKNDLDVTVLARVELGERVRGFFQCEAVAYDLARLGSARDDQGPQLANPALVIVAPHHDADIFVEELGPGDGEPALFETLFASSGVLERATAGDRDAAGRIDELGHRVDDPERILLGVIRFRARLKSNDL